MKRKTKRILMCLGVLALTLLVAINVVAYRQAYAMMHFTSGGLRTAKPEALSSVQKLKTLIFGVNLPKPSTSGTETDLSADTVPVTIHSSDGPTLAAWYSPLQRATNLVILFHGYAADKVALLPEAKAFRDLGCAVLLVDFRGSGESSESYTTIGFREALDVAAVMQYARQKLPYPHIILYGQSMGSASILRAVATQNTKPDGIIIEGVFDKLLGTVRNRCRSMDIPTFPTAELLVFWGGRQFGFNGFAHNPVDYASSVSCPALVMHGEDDPRALLAEAHSVYDAMRGPKVFKEFLSTGHESYLLRSPAEWTSAVSKYMASLK